MRDWGWENVLVWGAEFPGGGGAVVVCPAGDGGHGHAFAEDAGHVCLSRCGEVVVRDGSDRGMANDTPGVYCWRSKKQRKCGGSIKVHF